MESTDFFSVDMFIGVILVLSLIVGWVRGFTKEVLAIVAWGGGIYLATLLFPYAKEITRSYISHGLIADFVTGGFLFIVFLTALSMFNYFCSNLVKKSLLNNIDKVLGGILGIGRGIVILAIIDLIANQCMLIDTSEWGGNSRFRPIITDVSNFLILVLPENIQEKLLSHMSQVKKQGILDFIRDDISASIFQESSKNILDAPKSKIVAESEKTIAELEEGTYNTESFVESEKVSEDKSEKGQTAEELAKLKPKKLIIEKREEVGKKERNDLSRLLDQYDETSQSTEL